MNVDVKAFGLAFSLLCGGGMLSFGVATLIWPGYGTNLLNLIASVYPGAGAGVLGLLIATLYSMVDGLCRSCLFRMAVQSFEDRLNKLKYNPHPPLLIERY